MLCFDPAQGSAGVVGTLPADLRGLCLIGRSAVVGLCQIREQHIFGGLPVQQRQEKLLSGLTATSSNGTVGRPDRD